MNEFFINNKKLIKNALIVLLTLVFIYLFVNYLFTFVAPFVIGFILSLIYKPVVDFCEKNFKIKRGLGTIIAIILFFLFLSLIVSSALNRLYVEISALKVNLPTYTENIHQGLLYLNETIDKLLEFLPDSLQNSISLNNEKIFEIVSSSLASITKSNGLSFVKGIPNFFVILLISFLSSYFFSKDGSTISTFLLKIFPENVGSKYLILKRKLVSAVWGYAKAQMILMVFAFIICYIGFYILDSPYAFLLALATSFIDALPIFGSGFTLFPAIAISLLSKEFFMAFGYLMIYIAINIMRQILQPRVLSSQIGISPLLTLFSLYLGLKVLGVIGLIIGPIIAVLIKVAFEIPKSDEIAVQTENSIIRENIRDNIFTRFICKKCSEKNENLTCEKILKENNKKDCNCNVNEENKKSNESKDS